MSSDGRTRYEIDLSAHRPAAGRASPAVRALRRRDREELASLMLDAYRGTIDDEGETLDDATDEIDRWLDGSPMLEQSHGAVVDGRLASAVLLTSVDGEPLIAYVITGADNKGAGLGRRVVDAALDALEQAGHRRVAFFITDGNTPSERLFAAVGAAPTPQRR